MILPVIDAEPVAPAAGPAAEAAGAAGAAAPSAAGAPLARADLGWSSSSSLPPQPAASTAASAVTAQTETKRKRIAGPDMRASSGEEFPYHVPPERRQSMIDNRAMRVELAVLRHVEMPLKFRFRTSFGETGVKKFLLLELRAEGLSGWGECVAEEGPFYSPETISTASSILTSFLLPLVLGKSVSSPEEFERLASRIRGNRMAKAAVECALRDLFAKAAGVPLGKSLGGSREKIEVGVSLGISPTPRETVENVRVHVAQGYRRIKLKIEPGSDADRLTAVRDAFPDITLTVDANAAYTLAQAEALRA